MHIASSISIHCKQLKRFSKSSKAIVHRFLLCSRLDDYFLVWLFIAFLRMVPCECEMLHTMGYAYQIQCDKKPFVSTKYEQKRKHFYFSFFTISHQTDDDYHRCMYRRKEMETEWQRVTNFLIHMNLDKNDVNLI